MAARRSHASHHKPKTNNNLLIGLVAITLVVVTYFISQQVIAKDSPGPDYAGYSTAINSDKTVDSVGPLTPIMSIDSVSAGTYFVTVSAHISNTFGCSLQNSTSSLWQPVNGGNVISFTESYTVQSAGSIVLSCAGSSNQLQVGKSSMTAIKIKSKD